MYPIYQSVRCRFVINDAQNCLLELALALRAFHRDHGRYPDTLSGLSPVYLSSLPNDPFSPGNRFHYRLTKERYILYSVGPDGKDDGGTPIDIGLKLSVAKYRYHINADSTGDIIADINRW